MVRSDLLDRLVAGVASSLASSSVPVARQAEALRWLGETLAEMANDQDRISTVWALEDALLRIVGITEDAPEQLRRQMLLMFMVPLFDTSLLQEFDPVLRRCIGYYLQTSEGGSVTLTFGGTDHKTGSRFELEITEHEQEAAVLCALRRARAGDLSTGLSVTPVALRFGLKRDVPGADATVTLPVSVPFLVLALADDDSERQAIIDMVWKYAQHVDARLADSLDAIRPDLTADSAGVRQGALRTYALHCATSVYCMLRRNLGHGLRKLSRAPLGHVDAYCGLGMTAAVGALSLARLDVVLQRGAETVKLLRPEPLNLSELDRELLTLDEAPAPQRLELVARLARGVGDTNVFASLSSFRLLASIAVRRPDWILGEDEERITLGGWIERYIHWMLQPRSSGAEWERRRMDALALRFAASVVASRNHVEELASLPGAEPESQLKDCLFRSLLMSDRLLPILMHDHGWQGSGIDDQVRIAQAELGIEMHPQNWPDRFNPFLFGPGQYDHALAGALAIVEYLTSPRHAEMNRGAIAWFSPRTLDMLKSLAGRPETEAEILFRDHRDSGRGSLLGTLLDRTPGELALVLSKRYSDVQAVGST